MMAQGGGPEAVDWLAPDGGAVRRIGVEGDPFKRPDVGIIPEDPMNRLLQLLTDCFLKG